MLSFIEGLEGSGFSVWVNQTLGVFAVANAVHLLGIAMLFGTLLLMDLRMIGVFNKARPVTRVAADTLKLTWIGFVLALVSGLVMFLEKPVFYYEDLMFRLKMLFLLLAAINMLIFELHTFRSVRDWDTRIPPPNAARIAGALSLVFWILVIVFGRLLAFQEPDPFAGMDGFDPTMFM